MSNSIEDTKRSRFDVNRTRLSQLIPYFALHAFSLFGFFVEFNWVSVIAFSTCYIGQMFAITGFYHRYFSHCSYKTNRHTQFLMAIAGCMACQRGPIWWSAKHREHHSNSDNEMDPHSPHIGGFWWSHLGWFMDNRHRSIPEKYTKDWIRYPELKLLNRFDWVPPLVLAGSTFGLGHFLNLRGYEVSGAQLLVWGFVIPTVVSCHATYTINSLTHLFGKKRFPTNDNSRNNWLIAIVTLGEGWHNNHHHYPYSTRQGFRWWEIDVTYYLLLILSFFGIIWDLRPVPPHLINDSKSS